MTKALALLLGFGLASAASHAVVLPVTATFSTGFPTIAPVVVTGSGIGSSIGGGLATIPAGIFAGNPKIVVPVLPTFGGLNAITVPANSVNNPNGSFAPNGAMGLSGNLFFNLGGTAGSIPLHPIGGGGSATGVFLAIKANVIGATWQGGNKIFTFMGTALGNAISASATAYDNRNANGVGTVQLVAPSVMQLGGGILGTVPVFGTLTLTYTPEPGTLLLLAVGIAGLALRGRALRNQERPR